MRVTILGSGTSSGVPLIQCKCKVCRSRNPKNHRLRASVWIQTRNQNDKQNKSILIDTSPDLRQQALRANIERIDAVLFTHPHADHIHGIDDLRSFNFVQKHPIPAFGNKWTTEELRTKFSYIFHERANNISAIPQIDLHTFDATQSRLDIQGVKFIPISLTHGSRECVGYRIEDLAYVTDCSFISTSSKERLKNLSVLILDCVCIKPHKTHFNLDQALSTVEELKPKKTFLTHLGHEFDYNEWRKKLPKGVSFAYDGLTITT